MASLCSSSPAIQYISESHCRSWLGKVEGTNVSTMILRIARRRRKISWRIRGRLEGCQIRWSRKGKTKPNQTKPTFVFFDFKPKHQKLPTWNASVEDEEQISEGRGNPTETRKKRLSGALHRLFPWLTLSGTSSTTWKSNRWLSTTLSWQEVELRVPGSPSFSATSQLGAFRQFASSRSVSNSLHVTWRQIKIPNPLLISEQRCKKITRNNVYRYTLESRKHCSDAKYNAHLE